MRQPSSSDPKGNSQKRKQKSKARKKSASQPSGNIWGTTLTQLSNLSGVLEDSESDEDLVDNQDTQADPEDDFLGSIRSDIVGVQYYKGTVSNNEMVNLVREPNNQYDPNAIRIDNVTNEKVGHIKKEHAKPLSFIVDGNLAKVEGLIPFGANNKFRIPVVISLWGSPVKKDVIVSILKSHNITVDSNPVKRASSGSGSSLGASFSGYGQADYGHVVSHRTFVSPSEMENAMDQMFETLDEGDKTTEANPAQAIKTGLYPHQKQALNWMICRENKGMLPPFWEKKDKMYINTLTMCHTLFMPASVCGGILADDMGLGKTLQVISLILTNFVEGRPLAYPVQGSMRCPVGVTGKQIKGKKSDSKVSIVERRVSCEKSQQSTCQAASSGFPCSSSNPQRIEHTEGLVCPPNLTDMQVKKTIPLRVPTDEDKLSIPPKQAVEVKSSSKSAFSVEDPDYAPDVSEKVSLTTSISRSRRERKRPVRYCDSDEEDEDIKEKGSKAIKGKRQKKGAKEKSLPLKVADSNNIDNLNENMKQIPVQERNENSSVSNETSCTKVPVEIKENLEVLQTATSQSLLYPVNQIVDITAVQEFQNADLLTECENDTQIMHTPATQVSLRPEHEIIDLTDQVLQQNVRLPSKSNEELAKSLQTAQSHQTDSETAKSSHLNEDITTVHINMDAIPHHEHVASEVVVFTESVVPLRALGNAEVMIVIDEPEDSKENVGMKHSMGRADSSVAETHNTIVKSMPNVRNFLQKAAASPVKKPLNYATSSDKPLFVFDSDDDDLPDIPPSVPETKTVSNLVKLGADYDAATGRAKTSSPRGTLIICPLSVISNWVGQFEEHLDQHVHISLYVYYGGSRKKDVQLLKQQDVVITTYSTLASDFKSVKPSPLHKVEWLRIVLDEAHIIRNPASNQAKAVYQLQAKRKWAVTGTPIQNSMKDLWSLVNFLGVKPFTERSWWNRTIARPLAQRESKAIQRVSHLMRNLALRRTKTQQLNGRPLIALPDRHVYLEKITFGDEERAVYEAMQANGKIIIGRYFQQGTLLHHYGEVLAILTRLRQLCCHPLLVASAVKKMLENNPGAAINETVEPPAAAATAAIPQGPGPAATTAEPALSEEERQRLINQLLYVLDSGSDQECAICLDSVKRGVITACAHKYCRPCIEAVIENEQPNPKCPLCRGDVKKEQLIEAPEEKSKQRESQKEAGNGEMIPEDEEAAENPWPTPEAWQSSAKIDALMKGLTRLREEDPTIKSIVVSQFTSLLDLIEIPLGMQGFHFARLDGRMTASERTQAVEEFSAQTCGAPTVFLLSLKAGGVGINLTAASRVFLMDPAWNPASEEQCFDRCHRLGQTREVIITRFVIEDTVEERMLELQEQKRQLMKGAFGRTQSREERRTNLVNMIRNLIRI